MLDLGVPAPDVRAAAVTALVTILVAIVWERREPISSDLPIGKRLWNSTKGIARRAVALFGLVALLWMASNTPPVVEAIDLEPSATIANLKDGQTVPSYYELEGTAQALEGRRLYFAVYAPGIGIYFQPGPDLLEGGTWRGAIRLGDAKSTGAEYRVALGAADADAHRYLSLLLAQQRDTCKAWPEDAYPEGWTSLVTRTVKRGEWIETAGQDATVCPPSIQNAKRGAPWANFSVSGASKDFVAKEDLIRGEAGNLGAGHLYVLVSEKGSGKYWPQVGEVEVASNGSWSRDIYVGDDSSKGRAYNIIIGVADERAHGVLARWLQTSRDYDYKFDPLTGYPEGFLPLNSRTVTRH